MPQWHCLKIEDIEFGASKNGTTKFTVEGQPLRFQVPKGRVLYNGLSEYKSITFDVPEAFITWWRQTLEPALAQGLSPFNTNMKDSGLRVKVDKSTQFFNSKKEIYFPELKDGLLGGSNVKCIIEIAGTYFFQGSHGFIVRAHQIVLANETEAEPVADEESAAPLKGFAFI